MDGDDSFAFLILEHMERSMRGILRLFRFLINRHSDTSGKRIIDDLCSLRKKVDEMNRNILQLNNVLNPIGSGRTASPSCISMDDSDDLNP